MNKITLFRNEFIKQKKSDDDEKLLLIQFWHRAYIFTGFIGLLLLLYVYFAK